MGLLRDMWRCCRRRVRRYSGYGLVVGPDTPAIRMASAILDDMDVCPYCFHTVGAVREVVHRAIPFRILVLDIAAATPDEIVQLMRARGSRRVPFVILMERGECDWLVQTGLHESLLYFPGRNPDLQTLRETILIAKLQTA